MCRCRCVSSDELFSLELNALTSSVCGIVSHELSVYHLSRVPSVTLSHMSSAWSVALSHTSSVCGIVSHEFCLWHCLTRGLSVA